MLNLFRRHVSGCASYGKRTGPKCPRKPPCPIHFEGVDGAGQRHRPQALIDPRTNQGIRDWSIASEVVRDMEAPAQTLKPESRTTIQEAIDHHLAVKATKSRDVYRKHRNLLRKFRTFVESTPRSHTFMTDVRFHDLTDFCATWTGPDSSKNRDLAVLCGFTKYCYCADFTPKNIGTGLFRAMGFRNNEPPRQPFSRDPDPEKDELERIWKVLPNFPDQYGRTGQRIAKQVEAFVLLMRYTGLDVSTTMILPKDRVRGNQILTYRLKNGSEVWTTVPEWVIQKLRCAPHDSLRHFFWSGHGKPHTRASKWFARLRKLLDLAGLPHRTPHNFRHHFAIEHLLSGTPIEDVSRLLGHNDISITIKSYGAWIKERQTRLEGHQQKVWEKDPLHQRMLVIESADTTKLQQMVQ